MNHIATAEPSTPGVNYSLLIMETAMAVKMAVEAAMEMAPGAIPRPAGCRNREFCPPNWTFAMAAALEGFVWFRGTW